jgi:hypothetical protein
MSEIDKAKAENEHAAVNESHMTANEATGILAGRVLLVTGAAPYLGGPSTWKPLRAAAPEFDFCDLDLLTTQPEDDHIAAIKRAIATAAKGCIAIVAHDIVGSTVLEVVRDSGLTVPVLLLSPVAITRDSVRLRLFRVLIRGPVGKSLASFALSKCRKLVLNTDYLRKQLSLIVRSDAITPEILAEAHQRVADPCMEAFCARTPDTLLALLTPTTAFEGFRGAALFGRSLRDRKAQKRLNGTQVDSAWSAPMIEAPQQVADCLRAMLKSEALDVAPAAGA